MRSNEAVRSKRVVKALREADQKLVQSDKEGSFVVVPAAIYSQKAKVAIQGNFKAALEVRPREVKKEAMKLC